MLCSPASLAQLSLEPANGPWYAGGICPGNQRPWGQVLLFPGKLWPLQEISQCQTWGPTTLPGFPVASVMASLIAGSNLRHRSPESHLFVRGPGDQPGDGSDCSFVVRLGVENAVQGSSNLQLSAQACMSEAKHQLGLSFTSAVYKGSLTRAL